MFARLLQHLVNAGRTLLHAVQQHLLVATAPPAAPLLTGTLRDLVRSKPALIAENALIRQQLVILQRHVKRPRCTRTDRLLLVLLASRLRTWRHAVLIVQPETLLRWYRQPVRTFWRRKSSATAPRHRPPLAAETIALIRQMAAANCTWGAERIRGELLSATR
jgi:hypothetical protein